MIETLNWLLSIIGAVLGVAGSLVLVAVVVLLISLVKKMPIGIKRFVSAAAAVLLAFTLFKGLAAESVYIFVGRSLVYGTMSIRFADFALAMSLFFIWACANALFVMQTRARFEGVSTPKLAFGHNEKKQSSPSFSLKVSSVLLQ